MLLSFERGRKLIYGSVDLSTGVLRGCGCMIRRSSHRLSRGWWRSYRWRFVPWIAGNFIRSVKERQGQSSALSVAWEPAAVRDDLMRFLHKLASSNKQPSSICFEHFGFELLLAPSVIENAGDGVQVHRGRIMAGSLAALYPGTIYRPGDPALLPSLGNAFVFRCVDGILIDGNPRRLSRLIFHSCCGRDRIGSFETSDSSWLCPASNAMNNPLAVGQYVNNAPNAATQNVFYEELDLSVNDIPLPLRRFMPYAFYRPPEADSAAYKVVVLVARRDIDEGEELFSSYFTAVTQ